MTAEEETTGPEGQDVDAGAERPAKEKARRKAPGGKGGAEKPAAAEKPSSEPAPDRTPAGEPEPAVQESAAVAAEAGGQEAKAAGKPARKRISRKGGASGKAAAGQPTAAKERAAEQPTAAKEPAAKEPEKPAGKLRRGGGAVAPAPRRRVVRARARHVRTSARKARMVCGQLRGKTVQEARAILAFTPREVARDWSKLLESAVANAESNHELLEDDLIVREAYADEGPTIKRFRPR
ncbi:MAG TPA: 50S ribosomal protein L22, partial [Solirubrobacteraceae bacterium]|nr:50S ribosomal protein L22 [Solirubrobacteraceae bacterium]